MAELLNLNEQGVALQGFDPVSYFTGEPIEGNPDISFTHQGGTYYFSSTENKEKFQANPEKYIPEYGGFCAVAVSEGKTFPVDPKTYKILDDKLYLFYNGKLGNTKTQWEAEEKTRKTNADNYWQKQNIKIVYPTTDY